MMWLYHKETRAYAGQAGEVVHADFIVTDIKPPICTVGYMLAFGYENNWLEVPIPSVTRAQGRLALHRAGLLQAAEAVVAQAGIEARIWYEDAQEWERDHPVVIQMGAALGLTPEQIDELFLSAQN